MANVMGVLGQEIRRLARVEVRKGVSEVRPQQVRHRTLIADLRRRVALLERALHNLGPASAAAAPTSTVDSESARPQRITSKQLCSLRRRLRLSQREMATLAGVTPQAVYLWEHKNKPVRLRTTTRQAIEALRPLSVRQARENLDLKAKGAATPKKAPKRMKRAVRK